MQRSALKPRTCRNNEKRPSGRFFIGLFYGLILLCAGTSYGQKQVSRVLLRPEIRTIVIDCRQCFAIEIETAPTDRVTLEAEMEGEYQKDVLVQTEQLGQTLRIGTVFSPAFDLPNDKLGAHKVLSVLLRVAVPEDQLVEVYADQCQVDTSGSFRRLDIHINDGGCRLDHRAEDTRIQTLNAPITARVDSAVVEATSRYGKVRIDPIPGGSPHYYLSSTRGDIRVIRRP